MNKKWIQDDRSIEIKAAASAAKNISMNRSLGNTTAMVSDKVFFRAAVSAAMDTTDKVSTAN